MKASFNLIGLVIALLVIFGAFSIMVPNGSFYHPDNLELILRQTSIIGLSALGMTFVIIGGGIDLSVGSITAFTSVVVAWLLIRNFAPGIAFVAAIVTGALCGFINGLIITKFRVGPFIVTLGTLLIVRAVGKGLANNSSITPTQDTWLGKLIDPVLGTKASWHVFPWGVWMLIVLAILMALALRNTRFGRHVVAIGSNELAARLCGVPIDRVKLAMYALNGAFAGLAGVMLFAKLNQADPTSAVGMELDVIAAVVIGGASLAGGEGTIVGTIIGALIMQVIKSGGAQRGWADWIQEIVTGAIIVLAVALDRWRVRRASQSQ